MRTQLGFFVCFLIFFDDLLFDCLIEEKKKRKRKASGGIKFLIGGLADGAVEYVND